MLSNIFRNNLAKFSINSINQQAAAPVLCPIHPYKLFSKDGNGGVLYRNFHTSNYVEVTKSAETLYIQSDRNNTTRNTANNHQSYWEKSGALHRLKKKFIMKSVTETTIAAHKGHVGEFINKTSKMTLNSPVDIIHTTDLLLNHSCEDIPYRWRNVFYKIPRTSGFLQDRIDLHNDLFPSSETSNKLHININQHMKMSVESLLLEGEMENYEDLFTRLTLNVPFDTRNVKSKLKSQSSVFTHYKAVVVAYLAYRFNRTEDDIKCLMKHPFPNLKPLRRYQSLCDFYINELDLIFEQLCNSPSLLDGSPDIFRTLEDDCSIKRVFYFDNIHDLILTHPQMSLVSSSVIEEYAQLIQTFNVESIPIDKNVLQTFLEDRLISAKYVLEYFEQHHLHLANYKLSLFKFFREPHLLAHLPLPPVQNLVDFSREINGNKSPLSHQCDVFIPDTPFVFIPIKSFFDATQLNKLLKCVNDNSPPVELDEESGMLVGVQKLPKYKSNRMNENQRRVIVYLKNRLEASGREILDANSSLIKISLEDAKFVVDNLFKHGFSKKQILYGLEIFSYDKTLIIRHLTYMNSIYEDYHNSVKTHPQAVNILILAIERSLNKSKSK